MPYNFVADCFHTKKLCSRLGHKFLSFCHKSHIWQTDRQTNVFIVTRPRCMQCMHRIQSGKINVKMVRDTRRKVFFFNKLWYVGARERWTVTSGVTQLVLLMKYWTFWHIDRTASMKSGTLQNRYCGNMWTVHRYFECNIWFACLLQRILNCDQGLINHSGAHTNVRRGHFLIRIARIFSASGVGCTFLPSKSWRLF